MKPVASGAIIGKQGRVAEDALVLMAHASIDLPYYLVNPVCLEAPASPNLAAGLENRAVELEKVADAYREIAAMADQVIVEGIGGWRTPVVSRQGMADLVRLLGLPVILVVGIRLGCINHALLTEESIKNDGAELCGWMANHIDPEFNYADRSIEYLRSSLTAPLLGVAPYLEEPDARSISEWLQIPVASSRESIVS
jgi:dethiobiotin synthetase